jgi:hypothetical protein
MYSYVVLPLFLIFQISRKNQLLLIIGAILLVHCYKVTKGLNTSQIFYPGPVLDAKLSQGKFILLNEVRWMFYCKKKMRF